MRTKRPLVRNGRLHTPTMLQFCFACFLLLPVLALAGPGAHAPSGLIPLIDEPWNAFNPSIRLQANGWTNNYPGCAGRIINDPAAPESPPYVYQDYRTAGSASGGCSQYKNYQEVNRVYGRIIFRPSNPFQGAASGQHKVTGYIQHTTTGNNIRVDMWGSNLNGPWSLAIGFNGPADNCHLRGRPGFYNPRPEECNLVYSWIPHLANSPINAGQWNDIEWIFERGTCATCRDGKVIGWVNNVKVIEFFDVNLPNSTFNGWGLTHTWDGTGTTGPGDPGGAFDFDHMYLASYTGSAGNATLAITSSLPAAQVGKAYSATLQAQGGKAPYGWAISAGSLPAGLTLDKTTGVITGTPMAVGRSDFTVKVADSNVPAAVATKAYTIIVSQSSGIARGWLTVNGEQLTARAGTGNVVFKMPQSGNHVLSVHDLSGREVWKHSGSGEAVWNHGGKLQKGIYLVRAEQNGRDITANYCHIR